MILLVGDCGVHIPNVPMPQHKEMNRMKKFARYKMKKISNREIAAALVTNWLGAVLSMLGLSCQLAN